MMATMTTTIDPARSALLVMDYQVDIVQLAPEPDALVARMAAAIALARSAGVAVGYVRVAVTDADRAAVPDRNKSFSALATSDRLTDGTPGATIHPAVAPEAGDIVVRKIRVGAFSTTDLAAQLADRGIDTLILAGISTSGVVLSTIRDAADHDYRLIVLADCCADPDPEVHRILTERVFPRQADVVDSTELAGMIGSTNRH
jgi:nicotinamidase-related amidase